MSRLFRGAVLGIVLSVGLGPDTGLPQEAGKTRNFYLPVLPQEVVIDMDVLYRSSEYGQRVAAQLALVLADLKRENDSITQKLIEQEGRLADMQQDPSFLELAQDFDDKVVRIRIEQDQKEGLIDSWEIIQRTDFQSIVHQYMDELSQAIGFRLVLTQDDVFWYSTTLDITAVLIDYINGQIGDGTRLRSYSDPWEYAQIERSADEGSQPANGQ